MDSLAGFTLFTMGVMASLGLFMSGIAALRQARLSKRLFHLRYLSEARETSPDSESR